VRWLEEIATHVATARRRAFALWRRYGRIDVDDCVQQAMLEAVRSVGRHGPPHTPGPWISRIVDRVVWRELAAARRHIRSSLSPERVSEELGVLDSLARREQMELVASEISELPPCQQRAVLGYYAEGKSCGHIATELGASSGSVKQSLRRGRERIVERLKETPEVDNGRER
jgi:RNA polymerase sigma factor (sigma-70 family)